MRLMNAQKLVQYGQLMRLHRPIGSFLLLWPTLIALWLACDGLPSPQLLLVFGLGVFVMRSAGCIINDIADRHFDGHVRRTQARPLAQKTVSVQEALALFVGLVGAAFCLVLMTNPMTILLSLGALLTAVIYPFTKRFTHFAQFFLGLAFAWAIPMAYSAALNRLEPIAGGLFLATGLWALAYDTEYAMADREDDIVLGLNSTAILFGAWDKAMVAMTHGIVLSLFVYIGHHYALGWPYNLGCLGALIAAIYQQWLIKDRDPQKCFDAFLNNNLFGGSLFLGVFFSYPLPF